MTSLALINEWLGLPELASEHGKMVDLMMELIHWLMAVLFVGWSIFLCYVIWRFRQRKNPKANYHGVTNHASTHIEIAVIICEAVLLVGFAYPLWGRRSEQFPENPNSVKVRAVGEKFSWTFHYPGEDGIFGRTDPRLITPVNQLGRDLTIPTGRMIFSARTH